MSTLRSTIAWLLVASTGVTVCRLLGAARNAPSGALHAGGYPPELLPFTGWVAFGSLSSTYLVDSPVLVVVFAAVFVPGAVCAVTKGTPVAAADVDVGGVCRGPSTAAISVASCGILSFNTTPTRSSILASVEFTVDAMTALRTPT